MSFYFLGRDYTERHEFTTSRTYNPSNQFSQGMVNFAYDFTGDGWPDILMVDQRPIYLMRQPQGRVAAMGSLQGGAAGQHRDRTAEGHRRR